MKVDINNLRKQSVYALNNVIRTLNHGIMPEKTYEFHDIDGKEQCFEGDILTSTYELEKHINTLSFCISAMICIYDENNPNFKDLSDEVEVIDFNPLIEYENN